MEKQLIRKMPGKMIGGVAAGLAEYLDIDATIVRLLFVLATFFHGSGLLIYIVLWIAMPAGPHDSAAAAPAPGVNTGSGGNPGPGAKPGYGNNPVQGTPGETSRGSGSSGNRSAAVIGWILVGLGIFFLLDEFLEPWFREFFYWFNFRRIWPVVFIIVGALIISSATKKEAARQSADPDVPDSPDDPDAPTAPSASAGPPSSAAPPSPGSWTAAGTNVPAPPTRPGGSSAPGSTSAPGGSGSRPPETDPPASEPGAESGSVQKPRVPGQGPLNNPGNNNPGSSDKSEL